MEKLELKPKPKMILNVGGKDYEMHRPKVKAVMQLEDEMADAKDSGRGSAKVVLNFIVSSGLPIEIANELDHEELSLISEFLVDPKKNSNQANSGLPS